jgi:hypothetical protein
MCNSIWNKGAIAAYSQFVYITRGSNFPVGWEYTWPSGIREDEVKTFPNIQFGWNPWDGSTTTDDYTRDYMAFLKNPPDPPGTHNRTYNIKAFFDYLLGEGYINATEYMTIIHLGNEVWYGSGEVFIRNYAADVW